MRAKKVNESILGSLLIGYLSGALITGFIKYVKKRNIEKKDRSFLDKFSGIIEDLIFRKKDEFGVTDLDDRYYISLPDNPSNIKDFRIFKDTMTLQILDNSIELTSEEYNHFLNILRMAE